MKPADFQNVVEEILRNGSRYDREAYYFVREGLDYTIKMLAGSNRVARRHVSGRELLEGLRRFALDQFGPMAKFVLGEWGIHRCEDFGVIVFQLVDRGVLGKNNEDSPADFQGGYDFDEAFVKPFQPSRTADIRAATSKALQSPRRTQPAPRSSD